MPRPLTIEELKYKLQREQTFISTLKTRVKVINGKLRAKNMHNRRLLIRIVELQDIIDKKDAEIACLRDRDLASLRAKSYRIDV